MRASELESGFVVIEAGRTPEASLVAGGTVCGFAGEGFELPEVNVLVALGTFVRRVPIDHAL